MELECRRIESQRQLQKQEIVEWELTSWIQSAVLLATLFVVEETGVGYRHGWQKARVSWVAQRRAAGARHTFCCNVGSPY